MSVIGSEILAGASGNQGYFLQRSLRFRSSASAYLNRTFSSGNRKTWTWSGWVKRGLGSTADDRMLFSGTTNGTSTIGSLFFNGGGESLRYIDITTPSTFQTNIVWTPLYRDFSSWYHIILAVDTTQATASNRFKLYVNGVQVTSTTTGSYPSQNADTFINAAQQHRIGTYPYSTTGIFDGYMTEVNFIDGQALTPSSFGETSASTGVWQPKKYAGTYGTNGFYLPFSNNASTTTLGNDFSGNGNNWTTNNISLTAGSTYDSMTDVPTLTSATTANFAVLNPLQTGSYVTVSQGNLSLAGNTSTNSAISASTIGNLTSGKWYWEYTQGTVNSEACGIATKAITGSLLDAETFASNNGVGARANGNVFGIDNTTTSITSWTTGDVIGLALDCDSGAIYWSKNGTWLNSGVPTSGGSKTGAVGAWTPSDAKVITPFFGAYNTGSITGVNFGQRPFAYTPPTGFVALNTFNLPTPTIGATASTLANKYFDATTYTGNSTTQSIVNAGGFQPDFVWAKDRTLANSHALSDSIRGRGRTLYSNATNAESALAASDRDLISFNSNGFSVGQFEYGTYNQNSNAFVAWQWRASNATAVTNTAGSITSTVSANTSAGFSIVTYTGTAANATVGHGLGVAPSMIICKSRGSAQSWQVGNSNVGWNRVLYLNLTNAQSGTSASYWNNTAPTSTVFSLGSDSGGNDTTTMVAYCFSEVAGYSKFGSYTGNGSTDGTFIATGFKPKFVMFKRTDSANWWNMFDTARSSFNQAGALLHAESSEAERTANAQIDFLSNGFKMRSNTAESNASGGTYIYMAFAEVPQKFALGV